MTRRVALVSLAVAVMISGVTVATAQVGGPVAGFAVNSVAVTDVQASREELISSLLGMWAPEPGQSTEQLAIALRMATTAQLTRAREARSLDEVSSILGGARTNALGSTTGDYVYTAVAPCRIFDTRNAGGGGVLAAGATRDFYVYGTTDISNQGGNATGCASPRGEPRAVHINLTAAPVTGPGNLRVYPQNLATPPGVSSVNFQSSNIANALIVQTYYNPLGPKEIRVMASNGSANVIADVLGYFYDADLTLGRGKTLTGDWAVYTIASAAGQVAATPISYPLELASAPAAPAANFIAPGGAPTTNCPGTAANPAAAAGQLCFYTRAWNNASFGNIAGGGAGGDSDTYGAVLYLVTGAAGQVYSYGSWAVKAP